MTAARLKRLKEAADLAFDAELMRLRQLNDRIATLRKSSADLRSASVDPLPVSAGSAALARQQALWLRWRDTELRRLSGEIAELSAAREEQIARTLQSYGRSTAAKTLVERARNERTK